MNKYSGFAGLVEIGRTIDNRALDTIKERTGVELSVYMGNECVATTFMNETENNGADGAERRSTEKRAIGTTLDHQQILEVLNQGSAGVDAWQYREKPFLALTKPSVIQTTMSSVCSLPGPQRFPMICNSRKTEV